MGWAAGGAPWVGCLVAEVAVERARKEVTASMSPSGQPRALPSTPPDNNGLPFLQRSWMVLGLRGGMSGLGTCADPVATRRARASSSIWRLGMPRGSFDNHG